MLTRTMAWIDRASLASKEHFVAVCAVSAVTVIFFVPVLRGQSYSMVGAHMFAQYPWTTLITKSPEVRGIGFPQTDHADFSYPNSVFATNAIRSGQYPMWLPYNFSGVPEIQLDPGAGLLYPPKLAAMFFLSPIRQHDLMLFTHLLLAGLAMYALLRNWGANLVGAVFGAIVWEFHGRNSFWLTMDFITIAVAWLPVLLLGATLAVRKRSVPWAVATGIALGMAASLGLHDTYLNSVLLAGWFLGLTIPAARRLFLDGKRSSALLCLSLPVIALLTAMALSAPSWLLLVDLLSHVQRGPLVLADQLERATPFKSFISALFFPESPTGPGDQPIDFAAFVFVGVPALIFVVPGLFRRSAAGVLAIMTGVISLALVLGFRPLVLFFRQVLPYFGTLKLAEFSSLFCFAVAVLAALGITEMIDRLKWSGSRRNLFFACVVCLIAVESGQLVLFAWRINPRHEVKSEWLFPETPLIANLKNLQGEYHFLPISFRDPSGRWTPPVFGGKVNADFGLRSSSGYESLLPVSTAKLWRTVELGGVIPDKLPPKGYRPYFYHDKIPLGLLERLSIGFLVTPPNTEPHDVKGTSLVADGSLQLVYQGPDGWTYKLPHALPRAFLVPSVTVAADSPESLRMLVDPAVDVRRAAIVSGSETGARTGLPQFEPSSGELAAKAAIVKDRINEVEVDVDTPRPAMLVLNDMWDSGWKVEVDSVKQPLLEVNYAFRGVVVPAGQHRVMFRYRPAPLIVGLGISGATIFLLLAACVYIGIRKVRRMRGGE